MPEAELLEDRILLASLEVTSLADSGPGTLRALLAQEAASGGNATISFAPDLSGTINLATPLVINNETIQIQGLGPHSLAISNQNDTGIFDVMGTGVLTSVSDVTLIDSNLTNSGTLVPGAITAEPTASPSFANLNLTDVVFKTIGTASSSAAHDTVDIEEGATYSNVNITNCTFLGDIDQDSSTDTVAVESGGAPLDIIGSTFEDFSTAIRLDATSQGALVADSTFVGNISQGEGAAIDADPAAPLGVFADTFTNNMAAGGIIDGGSAANPVDIESSIVFGNQSGDQSSLHGTFASNGYNDIQNDANLNTYATFQGGFQTTDLIGVDPLLAGLGDYGGQTPTDALEPDSPVLTAGEPGLEATDQRGVNMSGIFPSIGAFEGSGVLFTVTSTGDNGGVNAAPDTHYNNLTGTFRQAVVDLDSFDAGTMAIQFDLPGTPGTPQTITISPGDLNSINSAAVIDGTTQPGYVDSPIVRIGGQGGDGLDFANNTDSEGSSVLGLDIDGFLNAIVVSTSSQPTIISGDDIGLDSSFSNPLPNSIGVYLNGTSNVTIGGTLADDRNVISGDNNYGLYIDATSSANLVENNFFGTTANGLSNVASTETADVAVLGNSNTIGGTTGSGNVLGGAIAAGASAINVSGDFNTIINNNVGVGIDGASPLPNATGIIESGADNTVGVVDGGNLIENNTTGVQISGGSGSFPSHVFQGNTIESNSGVGIVVDNGFFASIGGINSGDGNTISGNAGGGMSITGSGSSGIFVFGDTISNNGPFGVEVSGGANNIVVGNSVGGAANVISGNMTGTGVLFTDADTGDSLVENNTIVGFQEGVVVESGASDNTIDFNLITNNVDVGIEILGGGVSSNNLLYNEIFGNSGGGLVLSDASDNYVLGNDFGVDNTDDPEPGNGPFDIEVAAGSVGNTIGGTGSSANTIDDDTAGDGLLITGVGTTGNVVEGNFIGVDTTGTVARPNATGVLVTGGASGDTIGGTTAGAGNVISGNSGDGIDLDGDNMQYPGEIQDIAVQGNFIGTDVTGMLAVPNAGDGIATAAYYTSTFQGITIGGTTAAARNVISGNTNYGVYLFGNYTNTSDVIEGNYIGVDVTGSAALPNAYGVWDNDGVNDTIGGTAAGAGNVISSNDGGYYQGAGQLMMNGIDALIAGNIIGLGADGDTFSGASLPGVFVSNIGDGDTIGGLTAPARNVISGNLQGLDIIGGADILVEGNYIGTDLTGTVAIGNGPAYESSGDVNVGYSTGDTIGGTTPAARNIIAGSTYAGVSISLSTDIIVEGNYIGTDKTGTVPLPNYEGIRGGDGDVNVTIGGATSSFGTGAGNLIAGNVDGIAFDVQEGVFAIEGNAIGSATLPGGGTSPGNLRDGINDLDSAGASGLVIGGTSSQDANLISGNAGDGINLDTSSGVLVEGNLIGTDATGKLAVPNGSGVEIDDGSTANTIGGAAAGALNVISGNAHFGVVITDLGSTGNVVEGDDIGTDMSGTLMIANVQDGVEIASGASANTIGGLTATPGMGPSNLISGNNVTSGNETDGGGVLITGTGTSSNMVEGNLIGTNDLGTGALGNYRGVVIAYGASNNTIGGNTAGTSNLISGNALNGVIISGAAASGNVVEGNLIGTDFSGLAPVATANTVAWYRAEGNANDSAGSNNATLVGNVTYGPGQEGQAFQFDGSSYVQTPVIDQYSTGITFDVWINTTEAGNPEILDDGGGTTVDSGAGIFLGNGVAQFYGSHGVNGQSNFLLSDNASPDLDDGKWHQITATWTGDTTVDGVKLYVDGVMVAEGTALSAISTSSQALSLGGSGVLGYQKFVGSIDEAAVFDTVLTSQQVQQIQTEGGHGVALPNQTGIQVTNGASGNTIGGLNAGDGNVISGNSAGDGVLISGASATVVKGNFIGVSAHEDAFPNMIGVVVNDGSGNGGNSNQNLIDNNSISDNSGDGVDLLYDSSVPSTSNFVGGNTISGNAGYGVYVTSGHNEIDGGTPSGSNTIYGNAAGGVAFVGVDALDNSLLDNIIGLDSDGDTIGNGPFEVEAIGGAGNNVIGDLGEGNVISSNGIYDETGTGVLISGMGSDKNLIVDDDISGGGDGVELTGGASSTLVFDNTISDNFGDGVDILGSDDNNLGSNTISGSDDYGVYVLGNANTIGGTVADDDGNIIFGSGHGLFLFPNFYYIDGEIGLDGGGVGATQQNVVEGNIIGYDPTNPVDSSDGFGVEVFNGASLNTISGNTVSLNVKGSGVLLSGAGSDDNSVTSNFIGTDPTGMTAEPNLVGVEVDEGASSNTIGNNVIGGNTDQGIYIHDAGTTANIISGDDIGITSHLATVPDGASDGTAGLDIALGATDTTVQDCVISGNLGVNVEVFGSSTTGTVFTGNKIGTDVTGLVAISPAVANGPSIDGIDLVGATETLISLGNIISGNSGDGILLTTEANNNSIYGNFIGVDSTGKHALANGGDGVYVSVTAYDNTIGQAGSSTPAPNVISGNAGDGILISSAGVDDQSGLIGDFPPSGLENTATGQLATPYGSPVFGPGLYGSGSSFQFTPGGFQGLNLGSSIDFVGSSIDFGGGDLTISLAFETSVQGTSQILLESQAATYNGIPIALPGAILEIGIADNEVYASLVQPNYAETFKDAVGTTDVTDGTPHDVVVTDSGGTLSIYVDGLLEGTATNPFQVGDSTFVLAGNNDPVNGFENEFTGEMADTELFDRALSPDEIALLSLVNSQNGHLAGNLVVGNDIGTDSTGLVAVPNLGSGVVLDGVSDQTIGGTTAAARDVISGNTTGDGVSLQDGASANVVEGNYIGTDKTGNAALPNEIGIFIGSSDNTIGGTVAGAGNVLSGNSDPGFFAASQVLIYDMNAAAPPIDNVVEGNLIGLGADGLALPGATSVGVWINNGATGNTIGGLTASARNVISGNFGSGVEISGATGDVVEGNFIGTNTTGTSAIGNGAGGSGVTVEDGSDDTIGGIAVGAGNVIGGNTSNGVYILDPNSADDVIQGNFIGTDATGKIVLGNGYGITIDDTSGGNTIGGATSTPGTGPGNLISFNYVAGIAIYQDAGGEMILGNAITSNFNGPANPTDGVLINGSVDVQVGGPSPLDANLIADNSAFGIAVETGSVGTVIEGNTIGGAPGSGNGGAGIDDPNAPITVGGMSANLGNLISYNDGPGILLGEQAALVSSAEENRIAGNTGLGIAIDFTGDSRYPAENFQTTPAPNAPGSGLNAPVIISASIVAGLLTVSGYARAGEIIEFDAAQPDATGFGQGAVYLGTFSEGSSYDTGSGTGTYASTVDGHDVGSDPGASRFTFTFAIPSSITPGMAITALSEGTATSPSISEFGVDDTSNTGGGVVGPIASAGSNATILVGQTFSFRGTFGDNTSANVSATVVYGDVPGASPQPLTIDPINALQPTDDSYTPTATGYFELSHVYNTAGTYTVVVTLTDDDGLSTTTTLTVTVDPAPLKIDNTGITLSPASDPLKVSTPAIVPVDQPVLLQGTFTDINPGVTHTVSVLWGDGSQSYATVNEITHTFTATHPYTAPSEDVGDQGLYPVNVTITNSDNESSTTTEGLFYSEVLDTPPSQVSVKSTATVAPGGMATLSGSFIAPTDPSDLYHVVVDWGDGSTPSRFDLAGGVISFAGLTHQYLAQPSYEAGTPDTITVSVSDPYEPLAPATGTASVSIVATTASSLTISTDSSKINEGGTIHLSGTLVAAIPSDSHDVTINWGDGTTSDVILGAGVSTFSAIGHPYPFNSLNQPGGAYQITAIATDTTKSGLAAAQASTSVTVLDLAPSVSGLVLSDIRGNVLTQTLENTTVVLSGAYTNPGGVLDQDSVMINWGDGTSSPAVVNTATDTFTASHPFGDNPGQVLSFIDQISATATDSEMMSGAASIALTTLHATPTVAIRSGGFVTTTDQPILTAPISGGDTAPETYTWFVDGAAVSTSPTYTLPLSLVVANQDVSHVVSVQTKDSYGAVSSFSAVVDLLDDSSPTYAVPDPTSSVNAVFVTDIAGGKTIVAGTATYNSNGSLEFSGGLPVVTNLLTTPIIFDGTGAETFVGDAANDVFYLHSNGSTAYGMGGNNTFVLTPNCTLNAVANSGQNTLDFSTSAYGVSFNLNEADGTEQDVDPASPGDHFVGINDLGVANTFSTLVCSNQSDTITAATGSTIVGGAGMDTVDLTSVSGVTVDASGKGNQITASGTGLGNITYNGDANPAANGAVNFLNMGTVSGVVNFYGDQGSTTFNNSAGITTLGNISFSGDQGSTTFNNTINSNSLGTISFSGDQGSTTFNNGTAISLGGTISFSGDQGSTTFNNGPIAIAISYSGDQGSTTFSNGPTSTTLGMISFSGDQGSNIFNNGPGATQLGTISFSGDQGSATFNNGQPTATPISFSGDQGSTTFVNGVQMGTISFSGDQGSATFNNSPGATQLGNISFSGDQGSATFNNGSPTATPISFSGDQGSATFTNLGTISNGTISFSGDGGSATFNNNPGATQLGTISFSGDQGSATFNNGISTLANISFSGDQGSTTFINGVQMGMISFSGDQGSATFNNGPGSTQLGTISYSGDQGSAIFNNGIQLGTISYSGDQGSTTFVNGVQMGTISFSGDQGSATFNNGPGATQLGNISFSGDQGSATFNNGSPTATPISFSGDQGSATFTNLGTISNGTISFSGDGGSATFNNSPGATQLGTISFSGDQGSATFNNGIQLGTISYSGDQGSTTFVNGVQLGNISFSGDQGSATFNNGPGATQLGTISFSGDQNSNTFNNGSPTATSISFSGDQGSGTFTNLTTVNLGNISFSGDQNSNTFNNSPGATQLGMISFSGDQNSNTFINNTTTLGIISFSGDGNAELLWNQGGLAADLSFTGGTAAASSTLVNTGTITGSVTFTGNSGVDAFYNGAIVNGVLEDGSVDGSVTYDGGTGTSTFLNDGLVTGSISFQGNAPNTASAESLVNLGTVDGSINFFGDGGADLLENDGPVGGSIVYTAGTGTNTLTNSGAVGSITFLGDQVSSANPQTVGSAVPTLANEVLNQANGLTNISYLGGSGGNLLVNTGDNVGSITFVGFGNDNVLENSGDGFGSITFDGTNGLSTLINTGSATTSGTSTIQYNVESDASTANDTLENSGINLVSLDMTGGTGMTRLVNIGNGIGSIVFDGGSTSGTLLNSGSDVEKIGDTAGDGSQFFRNDGTEVGNLSFQGTDGIDYFLNTGSTASFSYRGSQDSDTVVNSGSLIAAKNPSNKPVLDSISVGGGGGTLAFYNAPGGLISGIDLVGTAGAFTFEEAGSLTDSTIDASASSSGDFTIDQGATLTDVVYISSPGGDHVSSYGSLFGFTFIGGTGTGELDLYGPNNVDVVYQGGGAGDTLVIGTNAGNVSGVTFYGGDGSDLLASDASNVSDVTFYGGAGPDTFWNLGAGASNLTLIGGVGAAIFDNIGANVTGMDVQGGSGGLTFDNTGDDFGSITFIGGSGVNNLTNTGLGTPNSTIAFTGGTGDNTLTNTGDSLGTISFQDGAGEDSTDSIVNGGSDIESIVMTTNAGISSLINTGSGIGSIEDTSSGGAPSVNSSGGVGSLCFYAGTGNASLIDTATNGPNATIKFIGGGIDDTFEDSATAGSVIFNAMGGGSQVVIQTGATGTITLFEGSGDNDYVFDGTPQANVTIQPPNTTGTGVDTLDFSTYLGGGLILDLMKTTLQAIAGGLSLTLGNPEEISHVIGTQYTNTIYGNELADTLDTAALPVSSTGNTPATTTTAATQWAYLDFDTYADAITGEATHVYTAAERQTILQDIQADYIGPDPTHPWFNVQITTDLSDIPSNLVEAGDYATLYFNRTPSTGQPGGEASEVDFGNLDPGGYASIQVNGLLGGDDQPANTTANFDILSAKIGAHEFAHLLGVRHSDAFGPIGYGIHTPPGSSEFDPSYAGPNAAFETFDHIISSPATQGTDRFNDLRPLDFGPREAIKIAFGEQGTITPETYGPHTTLATAMSFPLAPLSVPNTDVSLPDIEQGMTLQVVAGAVSGSIGLDPTTGLAAPDYFSFTGHKGDDYTIETESQELPALANGGAVDTVIEVFDSSGKPVSYYGGIAENDDQFEGTDSLLDDVILPADGTYYVKVTSYAAPAGDPLYDPTNPESPLYPGDTDSILNPVSPDYDAAARAAYIAAGNGQATGQFDLFIYRESQADPTAQNVNNVLVARGGGSTLAGSNSTNTFIAGAGTDTYLIGSDAITLSSSATAPVVDLQSAGLFGVTISDTADQSSWPVTINYGDGTSTTSTQAVGDQSLAISHLYATPGNYTVTIDYAVGQGSVEMTVPVTIVEAQAPVATITSLPTSPTGVNSTANFSGAIQNPYVGTYYTANWTFTNETTSQQSYASETIETSTATSSLGFSIAESFATAGTYSVALSVTNTFNQKSSTATYAGGSPTFTVVLQVTTSVTVKLPSGPIYYTGQPYAPPSSSIVVKDANKNVVANPSLSYSYSLVTTKGTTPLSQPPIDPGTYQLIVTYAGDSTHFGSQSQPVTFTISPATPNVSLGGPSSVTYNAQAFPTPSISVIGVNNASISSSGVTLAYSQVIKKGLVALSGSPTDAGSYSVVATYAATLDYTSAMSAPFTFTISQATPTITLTASGATYTAAPYAGASAKVTGVGNPPATLSGVTYTYYSGSTKLSSAPTDAGTYSVIASYASTLDYTSANSASITFIISQATPIVTLTAGNTTYTAAPYVGESAKVTGVGNPPATLSGVTYTYYSGSTKLSSAPTDAGSYSVFATYTATLDYATANSSTIAFQIAQAPLVVTIADASKAYGIDDHASLTGSISGVLGTDSITSTEASTGSTSSADAGSYPITASLTAGGSTKLTDYSVTYQNTAGTKTTGTLTVNSDRTSTSVASSAGSTTPVYGTSVTFTATIANLDSTATPIGSVEFYDGTVALGPGTAGATVNGSPTWTFTTSSLAVGSHSITAVYTPKAGPNSVVDFQTSNNNSAPLSQPIASAGTNTTTTGSVSGTTFGQSTTFTATVKAVSPSTAIPVGSVDFFDTTTNTDLGSVTLSASGVAILTTSLPTGSQTITLTYGGSTSFAASSTTVTTSDLASIYILNATASGALSLSGSASITVPGTVQVDSSSTTAIQLSGATVVKAGSIGVVGGTSVTGSSSFSVTPKKDASIPDPLAALPIPSATEMTTYAAVNLGGVTTATISPGIYPSISVGGSAKLTMQPGIYIITGGGFSISGAGIVNGSGVFIYNAGNNFNGGSGTTFGAFSLSAGTVNLSPPTSGPYAGILLFQSRDNTKALTISGAVSAGLGGGTVYAAAAQLQITGSAQIGGQGQAPSSLIVNELTLSGAAQAALLAGPSVTNTPTPILTGHLIEANVSVYVNDTSGAFTKAELARVGDAVTSANSTVEPYRVHVTEVTNPANATTIISIETTSGSGNAASGVLGSEWAGGITLVSGWNWYTGANPTAIGAGQYDFETIVLHEIGHALGLGHSLTASSTMFATLQPGITKRALATADLDIPDLDTGPCALHATPETSPAPVLTPTAQSIDFVLESWNQASTIGPVSHVDVAIDEVAEEFYLIPIEIAQDITSSTNEEISAFPTRKSLTNLRA